jgi:hypothetical protein
MLDMILNQLLDMLWQHMFVIFCASCLLSSLGIANMCPDDKAKDITDGSLMWPNADD